LFHRGDKFAIWNTIPLLFDVVLAFALIVKIPLEEEYILESETIRDEYRRYQHQVPWRLMYLLFFFHLGGL
jgi:protein-S-isoprenylcysteine O-methyltransferase Ste14